MAPDDQAISVLIVDGDDRFVADTTALLDGNKVYVARNMSDAQRRLLEENIGIAIVGPSFAHEAGVSETSVLFDIRPTLPIVLATQSMTTDLLRSALRTGIKDVIDVPLSIAKLEEAFESVALSTQRTEEGPKRSRIGRVVTIMSPKGGAGKTMTSTNTALSIAGWVGPERVVVLDADLQFGDICISLQIDPAHTIVDVARDIEKLDEPLLESLLATHSSGMRVLSAPLEPSLADEVSTQAIVKTIGMLKRMFDYIIIDTAPFLDEPVLSILERSDDVLLVVDMDLPSVKNSKLALDTLRLIKFPFEKIKLVLNRVNSKARLDVAELERSLGLNVMAAISSDKLVPRAVNEGVPVVSLYPRSRVARDLRAVARLVVTDDRIEDTEDEPQKGRWFK
ncbi:MAG TPA: response regulator [Actinobacteria bacterium]|nr:septum site-determining protein MinD [bacterium BMS3Bbin02]HDL41711.1 response regulator [Actinomycetota bacterium]